MKQINTLYYERSGLSKKPEKLSEFVQNNAEVSHPTDIIKSPFAFEFLGIKAKDGVFKMVDCEESDRSIEWRV